jgi:hypothetical protein
LLLLLRQAIMGGAAGDGEAAEGEAEEEEEEEEANLHSAASDGERGRAGDVCCVRCTVACFTATHDQNSRSTRLVPLLISYKPHRQC